MAVIEAVGTVYLESDVTSIEFDTTTGTIGTWEHLQLRCSMKSDRSGSAVDGFQITFNGDTTSVYSHQYMWGTGASPSVGRFTGTRLNIQNQLADDAAVTSAANFGVAIIDIMDYRNANKNTSLTALMGTAGTALWSTVSLEAGLWDATAAVTSILLDQVNGPNFMRGSVFTLYGLNSAN